MTQYIEDNYPPIQSAGLNTAKAATFGSTVAVTGAVTLSSTLAVTGAATISGALTQTGALTPTGGVAAAGGFTAPTVWHTGGVQQASALTTLYTHKQIVTTETYYAEVFIPVNTTLTGVSVLNGGTTNAGVSLSVGLSNSSGTIVASSVTTTAQSTASAYQQIPFSTTYAAKGPAKYHIAVQGSTTTGYLAVHNKGNFGASKVTSETYGTFLTTASYATTTFTADVGIIADTY